jgi:hypothetical protein
MNPTHMALHKWLNTRWLSLYDALVAIETGNLKLPEIAARLEDYLEAEDMEIDVCLAAADRLRDVVLAAKSQGREIDFLTQLSDDLAYFPDEIISLLRDGGR